jgi:hypothetical protein
MNILTSLADKKKKERKKTMNKELVLNELIEVYKESDHYLKRVNAIIEFKIEGELVNPKRDAELWWNRKHDARTDIINLLTDDEHFVDRYIQMNAFMKCFAKDINMKDTVKWFTNRENA